ncbi:MAG: pantetheine-phosphate adenylyltransferase [Kiritimatiellia bacterium]
MSSKAIYAGTFDPLTLGHLDLIGRAAGIFDRLILAVAGSTRKETLFTLDERVAMAQESVARFKNVTVESFNGLLVDYARSRQVHVVVRGLRAFSDFEFEFQMALMNRSMAPDVETMFLMPKQDYSYVSSSSVREVAELGGDVTVFVPPAVKRALDNKLGKRKP